MDESALQAVLERGEDSRHQFKADFTNVNALASELASLANGSGGRLFIGVTDDGHIAGLSRQDVGRLNQLISNAASQHVRPPLNPTSHNVQTEAGLVIVVRFTLHARPKIDLIDERDGNQFRAVVWRSQAVQKPEDTTDPTSTGQVPHKFPTSTPQVTPQVLALLMKVSGVMSRQELMERVGLKDRKHFAGAYLQPALDEGVLEMTIPDKPQSSKQRYRLTDKGRQVLAAKRK